SDWCIEGWATNPDNLAQSSGPFCLRENRTPRDPSGRNHPKRPPTTRVQTSCEPKRCTQHDARPAVFTKRAGHSPAKKALHRHYGPSGKVMFTPITRLPGKMNVGLRGDPRNLLP